MTTVLIMQLPHAKGLNLPRYATTQAAAADLEAAVEESLTLKPGQRAMVPTGLCVAVPQGYELQVRARSGLAAKHGISLVNGVGTVDADYRGEIKVILINLGDEDFVIERGMRIAQALVAPAPQVEWQQVETLDETERGTGGFGSTGVQTEIQKAG